ncbi:hypothetical protein E5K00_01835 [Hymenobacter aquaticus]|uniref:Lipocalin-like domain-containing protein n=1 Tax=Hymenobacter aquaticus TaxID=1867101 RepID=A0A4Z0Q1W3_9BACT|nr:hypothetical protein [Hymenobacter aquaticus]TGE23980.1 hypothetical protein E5K00_01835 [Hymenobacter aquaticus]
MPNVHSRFCLLASLLVSACNSQPPGAAATKAGPDAPYPYLRGTWVEQTKTGFTLLEIQDTAHVRYHFYGQQSPGKDAEYYYAASQATMGYHDHNSTSIWVLTDHVRLDYKIDGDQLREYDKMGEQAVLRRVYTGPQQDYREFDGSQLRGVITDVQNPLVVEGATRKRDTTERLVLNDRDRQYTFTTVPNATGRRITELAAVGDSVIKPKFSDTLVLRRQHTGQRLKFTFRKF